MKKLLNKGMIEFGSAFINKIKPLGTALLLSLVFVIQSHATKETNKIQDHEIKGIVMDSDNSPLPGVNVTVVGTLRGTATDFDGNYVIIASEGDVLKFSYVGMEDQLITVGANNTINATMTYANSLNEVIVVGYGSQRKRDITGAISAISAEDIVGLPVISAEQALQGKASGVTIINAGSPGSSPVMRIRGIGTYGDNSPIFVVDGVITENISNLSPNDIKSMSVLKDASTTAVYGSLGANGVIVIKTKKGKRGKVTFNFDSYVGIQSKPKSFNLLNADQYVAYAKEMELNAGTAPADLPVRLIDPAHTDFIKNNTDWQDAIFKNGMMSNYQLSASGGTENAVFRLSGGYQNQEGILLNTGLDKYNFRLNSEFNKGRFTFGENLSVAFSDQNPQINANNLSPIENAIKMAPYLKVYNADNLGGFSGLDQIDGQDSRNPVRTLTQETMTNKSTAVLGDIYGTISLLDGLDYSAGVGINYSNSKFKDVALPYYDGDLHSQNNTSITIKNANRTYLTLRNSLNYKKTFNEKHNFEALVLAEKENRTTNFFSGSGITDFGFQELPDNSLSNSKLIEYNKIGYLGRLNYNFDGKYLLGASLRRDASSRFGENNRWGTFPAISAGWVISEELFIGENSKLNFLKLRGSWGIAGNDKTAGDYAYESTLLGGLNYGNAVGLGIQRLPNPDLKWEETTMTNIGLDFGLFNNNISASVEYYNNTSTDLIVIVDPSVSSGILSGTPTNVGGMTTSGFEFNLGYKNRNNALTWGGNFNISTSKNIVNELADSVDALYNGASSNVLGNEDITRTIEGESFSHFYGYQTDGIFQNQTEIDAHATQTGAAPGDIRFLDTNGRDGDGELTGQPDGVISEADKVIIGNPFPELTYGLSLDAGYKNFDFGVFFSGVSGNDIFNANRYFLDGSARIFNASTAVLDRWTPTNPSTTQPRAINGDPNGNTRVSDRYVENGSYLKLKNLSLGYSFPKSYLKNLGNGSISKIRFYVSGQNLFTATEYSGYDPELAPLSGNANTETGIDRGQYPQTKSVLAGLQLTF